MRALFALGTGVVLGTIAALWLAARGDAKRPVVVSPPEPAAEPVRASLLGPLPELDDAPVRPQATAEPEEVPK